MKAEEWVLADASEAERMEFLESITDEKQGWHWLIC